MPRSCNKRLNVCSYCFSSVYDVFGLTSSTLATVCNAITWKYFLNFLQQNSNLQMHSAVNHRCIYEACQAVLKEIPLWTPQALFGGTFLSWILTSAGLPAGKGQKNNNRFESQEESRVNPACFIWLISLIELL